MSIRHTLSIFVLAASCAAHAAGESEVKPASQEDVKTEEAAKIPATENAPANKSEVKTLDAYEVTAMRFSDSLFDLPASTQNISSQTIEKSGLVSVPDILRRYADVNIRNTGSSPFTSELSMRGFGENSGQRVMVIVDGQRLNTLDLSFINWAQLPLENIENIEVMRGPQTAAYGNYAESGVIKITTKRWNQPDSAKIGGFFGTYGEYQGYARASHSDENYFATASANYYHNSGYVDNSLNWNKNASVAAGAKLDEQNDIVFTASGGDEFLRWANPLYSYSQMMENPTANSGVSSENNLNFATVSAALENNSSFGEGAIQMGANMREVDTLFPSTWGDTSNSVMLWTASFTPRYRIYMGEEDESYVEGGLDFYYDNMVSKRYSDGGYSNKIASTDIERITVAPWLGGRLALDDVFSITAAGRYESAINYVDHTSAAPYDEHKNFGGLAGQIGLNAKIDESWNVYFRFDQVYRYPAIDEMASYWGYATDAFNPLLNPERGQNYEIGANFVRGPWRANCSLFFMHLDNEIMLNPATYTSENIGSTDRFGADVRLGYELENFGVSTAWAFVSAKFDGGEYNGNNVPLVPTIVSTTRVWVKPVKFLELAVEYEWASGQYMGSDFGNTQEKMPAVWTLNVVANIFISENVRAFAAFNNVTDEIYASYAVHSAYGDSWYPALGRNVRVGVEFKF